MIRMVTAGYAPGLIFLPLWVHLLGGFIYQQIGAERLDVSSEFRQLVHRELRLTNRQHRSCRRF